MGRGISLMTSRAENISSTVQVSYLDWDYEPESETRQLGDELAIVVEEDHRRSERGLREICSHRY